MHMISIVKTLVAVSGLISLATNVAVDVLVPELGINCRGSSGCGYFVFKELFKIRNYIVDQLPDDAWVENGRQIACSGVGDIHPRMCFSSKVR